MMRARWLVSWVIGVAWCPLSWAWEIASFEARVMVHEDATATVQEMIIVDFGQEHRRGIYRDLPIHYTDRAGQHFTLRFRVEQVTDAEGRPWPYRVESAGRARRIRIGEADRFVTGEQSYAISYDIQRGALRFFPDHDECYWNLTGNEWAVPMRRLRAEVRLPEAATDIRTVAYMGGYGSTAQVPQIRVLGSRVILEPLSGFGPYEGLTVAVGWGKGAVHPPSAWQVVGWWLEDNWVYGLPLGVLIGMTWLWAARGREPRLQRSQVVEYAAPDGLSPAEVGTLIDQRVNLRDITATVIDLAVRGYVRIEPRPSAVVGLRWASDYTLVSLKPWDGDSHLKPHERKILWAIFDTPHTSKNLSDLEQVFYRELPAIRQHLYEALVKHGYFDSHPEEVRIRYLILAGGLGGTMMMGLLWFTHQLPQLSLVLASGLSTVIVVLFSLVMPRRTLKGAQLTDRITGFVEFLKRADADRIRRMNDASLFERCLPYALAFGVADRWAKAFEGMYTQPPSWYAGDWDTFSARRVGSDVHQAMSSMGRAFASQPRSGGSSGSWGGGGFGGGFSGGGGGGGGGGAW